MLQLLRSILAIISLLALAVVAVKANSAPLPDANDQWQAPDGDCPPPATSHRPPAHRLVPGPQPGTHLQTQPFAYGYFGAHAPTTAAFHRNSRGDWYQWTFSRAD
jgi:hypothetical protein